MVLFEERVRFSGLFCRRGMFIAFLVEALHMEVQVALASDVPNPTEIRMKFRRVLHESIPAGDDD